MYVRWIFILVFWTKLKVRYERISDKPTTDLISSLLTFGSSTWSDHLLDEYYYMRKGNIKSNIPEYPLDAAEKALYWRERSEKWENFNSAILRFSGNISEKKN